MFFCIHLSIPKRTKIPNKHLAIPENETTSKVKHARTHTRMNEKFLYNFRSLVTLTLLC